VDLIDGPDSPNLLWDVWSSADLKEQLISMVAANEFSVMGSRGVWCWFLNENGRGPGARLGKPPKDKSRK